MIVSKCDRCGKYVDKDVLPRITGKHDPLRRMHSRIDIKMDLCPECYMLLREFLGYDDYKPDEEKEEEEE